MAAALTRDDVIKLAYLARLDLDDNEIDSYIKELNEILDYVGQLKDVDVDSLAPTNQVTGLVNVWREDKTIDYGYKASDMLNNVPDVEGDYIKSKRMIG